MTQEIEIEFKNIVTKKNSIHYVNRFLLKHLQNK